MKRVSILHILLCFPWFFLDFVIAPQHLDDKVRLGAQYLLFLIHDFYRFLSICQPFLNFQWFVFQHQIWVKDVLSHHRDRENVMRLWSFCCSPQINDNWQLYKSLLGLWLIIIRFWSNDNFSSHIILRWT